MSGYDSDGNLTAYTDRNGRTTQYQYDQDNQLVKEDWLGALGSAIYTAAYTYDADDRLILATDSNSTYGYSYDALSRVTQMSGAIGLPSGFTVGYAYNNDDQVTERDIYGTGSSPLVIDTYAYDGQGRPTGINESGSAVAAKSFGYTYVAPGQPLAGMLASE